MNRQGVAVYGGTFDPIHNGHLELARQAYKALAVESVHFVVAADPPHKPHRYGATADDRYRMVELALRREQHLIVDGCELRRDGPSYTIDTLRELSSHPAHLPLRLLIGADNLVQFKKWREADKILELAELVVFPRPDCPMTHPVDFPVTVLPDLALEISSTEIRARIQRGEAISEWVPTEVCDYLEDQQPYGSSPPR